MLLHHGKNGGHSRSSGLIRLSDSAYPIERDEHTVQFGIDATRCGVLPVSGSIAGLLAVLRDARTPTPQSELLERLKEHLSAEAAASIIDDLLAHGILVRVPPLRPAIAIVGRGRLADAVERILQDSAVTALRPRPGQPITAFLAAVPRECPVLAVNVLAECMVLAAPLAAHCETVLPTYVQDGRGVLGPLVRDGEGPCMLCTALHATERDPLWFHAVRQPPPCAPCAPATVVWATAAAAASVALHLAATATGLDPLPGAHLRPGWHVTLSPSDPGISASDYVPRHPRCPVCWTRKAAG